MSAGKQVISWMSVRNDQLSFDCGGKGNVQNECANTRKRRDKSLTVSYSDTESSFDEEDCNVRHILFVVTKQETTTSGSLTDTKAVIMIQKLLRRSMLKNSRNCLKVGQA